jgi:ribosome-binding factor A
MSGWDIDRGIQVPRRSDNQNSGPSQRALRAGELIRHALAEVFSRGDVHDPVIETHLITVPEVRMSPDLRLATIYVMPLGGRDQSEVIAALERNKKFLRGELARAVNLKFAPDIRFRVDERFDEAERIERLLRTPVVKRDLDTRNLDTGNLDTKNLDTANLDTKKTDENE